MLGRHSLFWKLALLLLGFCLLIIWVNWSWTHYLENSSYRLAAPVRERLLAYRDAAERAWRSGGDRAVDAWLTDMADAEPDLWMAVIGGDLGSLSSTPLRAEEARRLTLLRRLDWPISNRYGVMPLVGLPFSSGEASGQLVVQLPERLLPEGVSLLGLALLNVIMPGLFAMLLCVLLYRLLIAPLAHLRRHANALRGGELAVRVAPAVSGRQDELGELARAFDHMTARLEGTLSLQRQLLRGLSHELRTPLSRLQVLCEDTAVPDAVQRRLAREVSAMQRLVDDTLELVWLEAERPRVPLENVDVASLWTVLKENACFESGWAPQRLIYALEPDCRVHANLNALAQALENVLRNAIRHSPEGGTVRLAGRREGDHWHLWLEDQGSGVPDAELENMFRPFTRLVGGCPGGEGYGLGLSIARFALRLQGGRIWAENARPGLRVHLRLQSV
jgi:two-component system sensor histidine kinase PfeS